MRDESSGNGGSGGGDPGDHVAVPIPPTPRRMRQLPQSAFLVFAVLSMAAGPTVVHAQQKVNVRIMGVFDDVTGQPIVDAEVVDVSSNMKAITSSTGMIPLTWLAQGTTILQVRKLGYASKLIPVTVAPADTEPITVVLKPMGTVLPEVVTTEKAPANRKMVDFEARRRQGLGHYLTQDQLDRRVGSRLSDILPMIGSIRIIYPPQQGSAAYAATVRGQKKSLRE